MEISNSVSQYWKGSRTLTHVHTWVSIAMIYNHSHLSRTELAICLQILIPNRRIGRSRHRRREKYETVSCTHEISCIRAGLSNAFANTFTSWMTSLGLPFSARRDSVTELRVIHLSFSLPWFLLPCTHRSSFD